jgi:hypothetical protein
MRSVFLPSQEEIQRFANGSEELLGRVQGFSDSGASYKAYAVVEVTRTLSLVVPVDQLRMVSGSETNGVESGP